MSEEEFELMDELYFVQPYSYLKEVLDWEDEVLLTTLQGLYERRLIKCLLVPDQEIFDQVEVMKSGTLYYYLATKKGLMEHNTL
ncbi:hypothetical protein DN752_06980 [Echinicola strongylocentroti]|uniref:Uncharacterized protein n=1 Tax=Echinicola strongylocentroti TaxID=1795355 RepID=A0A2Z4IFJ4_9BACT|nr:hypothetical protein [Echinicola strongylocentroti]AWW29881.1 hypothetical protein DN752_06980 [Echinicola strongylocentroti]